MKFRHPKWRQHAINGYSNPRRRRRVCSPQSGPDGRTDVSKDRKFSSVWDAIESTPRQAVSMRARSELMMALQEWVKAACKTQGEAAKLFGVTQPRMSDLMRGRLHLFSLETLMDM